MEVQVLYADRDALGGRRGCAQPLGRGERVAHNGMHPRGRRGRMTARPAGRWLEPATQ